MREAPGYMAGGRPGAGPLMRAGRPAVFFGTGSVPPRESADDQPVVGCGRALTGEEIAIVDPESRERLADGRVGEIWGSGPNVAQGYWRNPDETKATFRGRVAGGENPAGLRTRDLG